MRRIDSLKFVFALAAFFAGTHAHAESPRFKLCVLNFEHPRSRVTSFIKKLFVNKQRVLFYAQATPLDLVRCIQARSEQILLIAHALTNPNNSDGKRPVNLGFFLDLQGSDRREYLSQVLASLRSKIGVFQRRVDIFKASHFGAQILASSEGQSPEEVELLAIHKQFEFYYRYPESEPLFALYPIMPRAFSAAREALRKQALEPDGVALKKFRLMSCLPQQVLAQYGDLRALIEENKIDLDIAPPNRFLSFVLGEQVTSPDPGWLRESLKF